ncbi:MAG TPA: cytochrome b N-terminal domain-containing protein [Desulfuromonadales bacterium]|nr:cytochrome b N-terminal domain-containing protein [Desulfuromonadales bacterium]
MLQRLNQWINDRWPLNQLIEGALEEDVAGGASFSYSFGSAVLFLFVLQALTGVFQLFYYVPTVDHAYDSLNYLRTQVPFGWLIHNLHYWGANAMIVLVCTHICRVYIWGAYKRPRELTWLIGVGLFLLVLGMTFTGALLPWDELGYWAAEVGTSIAGTVPVLGIYIKELMRGGGTMNQLTLSRMFIVHVALLPGLLAAVAAAHLISFRTTGNAGPWNPKKRELSSPFWPDQVYRDMVVICLMLLVLIGLSVFLPPHFTGPADPFDTTYHPKPEWNFLFLYQMLKLFPGSLEVLGTAGIPLVGVLAMLSIPFIDRSAERDPLRRPRMMTFGVVVVAAVTTFTILGALSHPGAPAVKSGSPGSPPTAIATAANAKKTGKIKAGKALFASQGCIGCHKVNGKGGTIGPELSGDTLSGRSKAWLAVQIRTPKKHFPTTVMPAFGKLTDAQIDQLIAYLQSVTGKGTGASKAAPASTPTAQKTTPKLTAKEMKEPGAAASMIGNAPHGALIFHEKCQSCHGSQGTGHVANPGSADKSVPALNPIDRALYSSDPATFAHNIDLFIQHGSIPAGPHPALHMLAFGDSHTLSQQEIAEVEAYILKLNGVERGQLVHPGMKPEHFFLLVVGIFLLVGIGAGLVWQMRR